MKQFTPIAALAGLIPLVHGHGFVTKPQPRMPGDAMSAACGKQVQINQQSDNYGNIQGELQVASGQQDYSASNCDIWLCKGYKFADNKDNVQSYKAGQTVPFTVDIRAPHTGVANVSVVETSSNSVIGRPLISWDVYASTATGVTKNETDFSVTIPEDLGDKCATAGDCVLQWYWYAQSIDQTYESCVDFTVGGSGSSSSGPSSSSSSEAAPVETSAAVQATTAAAETTTADPVQYASTTFATQARQSAPATEQIQTPSAATATASPVTSAQAIPTNGTAQQKLDWIAAILKYLVNGN
ncbi:hypothetical protein VI817_005406 [Penicillium citrinum]|uniref:Chitin-binding type-4 domain-containing protein n=1 Tax=Penicillium hetheringtonii TaxID=911720 RepID=A0AAD6DDL6_9EURO|nr:hypothetical protein N7450_008733 [Penicillium hetheringtonii]KAK5796121.1 hypothetical protein VI817_005406 [Penicillium citrinum]